MSQLSLFDEADTPPRVRGVAPSPVHQALARKLPENLYLGCSSWSFPGWEGLVYEGRGTKTDLARHGLAAYATHPLLTSVGIDRTYYAPLSATEFAAYRQVSRRGSVIYVTEPPAASVLSYPSLVDADRGGARSWLCDMV